MNKKMSNTINKAMINKEVLELKRKEITKLSQERARLMKRLLSYGLSVIEISKITALSRQRVYKIIEEETNE
jgi:DNA invertase Pin-like site-specific DNA recombinase|tara:strand:- start:403 stop:618 length:216 start_codon:yes stop_codon:yes gene_type:complete